MHDGIAVPVLVQLEDGSCAAAAARRGGAVERPIAPFYQLYPGSPVACNAAKGVQDAVTAPILVKLKHITSKGSTTFGDSIKRPVACLDHPVGIFLREKAVQHPVTTPVLVQLEYCAPIAAGALSGSAVVRRLAGFNQPQPTRHVCRVE